MISSTHRKAVEDRIKADVHKLNEHYNMNLMTPDVVFDVRGRTAGYVTSRDAHSRIHLNPGFFVKDADEMINSTTPHELAHWAEHKIHGGWERTRSGKRSVHGRRWKAIMRVLGADDSRCHNMSTEHVATKQKTKYEYECSCCKTRLTVGPVVHKKIQAGQTRWHSGCNRAPLVYVGVLGKVSYAEAAKKKGKRKPASQNRPQPKPAPRVPTSGSLSKKQQAMMIYRDIVGNGHGKDMCIQRFMDVLNMTKAGATTYYYNCRKEA